MDRESVITHLQIIHTWAEFARERDLQFTAKHLEDIAQWADDAIALLKEQEPVKPVRTVNDHGFHYDYCGNCERLLPVDPKNRKANFCPCCGRPVNWSDDAPEEKTEIANDYTVQIAPRQIPLKW